MLLNFDSAVSVYVIWIKCCVWTSSLTILGPNRRERIEKRLKFGIVLKGV